MALRPVLHQTATDLTHRLVAYSSHASFIPAAAVVDRALETWLVVRTGKFMVRAVVCASVGESAVDRSSPASGSGSSVGRCRESLIDGPVNGLLTPSFRGQLYAATHSARRRPRKRGVGVGDGDPLYSVSRHIGLVSAKENFAATCCEINEPVSPTADRPALGESSRRAA